MTGRDVEPVRTLAECERIVERGQTTFVEVGRALSEIRDRRLYREAGYSTFDAYCRNRWGWSRQHAYRLIGGANVADLVSPTGDIVPSERVIRELAPLAHEDAEAAVALWTELRAAHGEHLTAARVRDVVRRHLRTNNPEPDFQPVSVDSQPRLDRRRPITCPDCGHEFLLPR